jgi:hypothetical protein
VTGGRPRTRRHNESQVKLAFWWETDRNVLKFEAVAAIISSAKYAEKDMHDIKQIIRYLNAEVDARERIQLGVCIFWECGKSRCGSDWRVDKI